MTSTVLVWTIVAGTIAGILMRPRGWPEAAACIGAAVLVLFRLPPRCLEGNRKRNGCLFVSCFYMMLLAELARREAGSSTGSPTLACRAARGSPRRLLITLVYGKLGILVTVFLSNDATAVVLTPAVCAVAGMPRRPRFLISELRFYRRHGKFLFCPFQIPPEPVTNGACFQPASFPG